MDKNFDAYKETYIPLLRDYAKSLLGMFPADEYAGIPQNFIPEWGVDYFKSDIRIAFVGLETRGWGDMSNFLRDSEKDDYSSAYDMSEFQDLNFLNWNDTHRHTFWGFNSFFLGALYGLKNWEVLKWGQHKDILRTMAWGNATSVERWPNCKGYGAKNPSAWEQAKRESFRFDDINLLLRTCRPHVVLLLCGKAVGMSYLRNCSESERRPVWSGGQIEVYRVGGAYVFHASHPAAMKFNGGAAHYAKLIRDKMIEYGVFRPLPPSIKDDSISESFIIDLLRREFSIDQPNTFDVVMKIAVTLRKQESLMPVSMLVRILNNLGCRNNYGGLYAGGRGTYRMLQHFYYRDGLNEEEKDAIAMAFVNESGWHPWDKRGTMEFFRIKELEESSRHWDTFYQCPQLENRGTDDALSESVAEWLIGHCENGLFRNESIRSYIRAEYNMSREHRQQLASFLSKVNHKPEHNIEYAMFMRSQGSADIPLNVSIGEIGIVLDHQVPLVDDTDAGVRSYGGEIDLLSYSSESNTMFILELKEPKSSESLLKCMIEGYTYFRRIGDISKFKRQFNVPESANVVIAPLFLEGSAQHRGYLNLNKGKRNRIELFEKIDVDMRARLGDNRWKVAFAIVNRTTRFTPHNSLDGLKVSVSRLDAVRSNQK